MATWSKELALESAKVLIARKPAVLAVGHGRMLKNPVGAMQKAVTHAESTVGGVQNESETRNRPASTASNRAELADQDGLHAVTLAALAVSWAFGRLPCITT